MKLRIRNQQTKQTLKLEISNTCTFQQLKHEISQHISSSSSSSSSSSVSVSLNGKDEIHGAPDDSLPSLGIASGDLIYYSIVVEQQQEQTLGVDFNNFEEETQYLVLDERNLGENYSLALSSRELGEMAKSDVGLTEFRDPYTLAIEIQSQTRVSGGQHLGKSQTVELVSSEQHGDIAHSDIGLIGCGEYKIVDMKLRSGQQRQLSISEGGSSLIGDEGMLDRGKAVVKPETVGKEQSFASDMDEDEAYVGVDQSENDELMEEICIDNEIGSGSDMAEKNFTAPCFLRKVLRDELSDNGSAHRLLVIALHAVLLDSGFVQFDPKSNTKVSSFQTPDEWPSISLWYTLPGLIDNGSEIIESVAFKLQSIGYYTIVYGSLTRNGSQVHTVRLNEQRFARTIDLMWASKSDSISKKSDSYSHSEREVFEFWKMVKDQLLLPLLIDLCDRAGYELPPCLMQLPTDLKLMILELLPGVDVAKVGCVCSELRYLSSKDDLWKRKYIEEFGDTSLKISQNENSWKAKFVSMLNLRKECDRPQRYIYCRPSSRTRRPRNNPLQRIREPIVFPRIIGGDQDLWPDFDLRHGGSAGMPMRRHGLPSLFPNPSRRRLGPP